MAETRRVLLPGDQRPANSGGWLASLSAELLNACLLKMGPDQVLSLAQLSKLWYGIALDEDLWHSLVKRDWATSWQPYHSLPPKAGSWRQLYKSLHKKHHLKIVAWERVKLKSRTRRPSPREGHSFAPYGDGAVLFGGWTSNGIQNDVSFLSVAEAEPAWSLVPARQGAPSVPRVRYGHSLTRCGPPGSEKPMLIAFGGLASGGYRMPLVDMVVMAPAPLTDEELARMMLGGEGEEKVSGGERPLASSLRFTARDVGGVLPMARGHHAATASQDGSKLYIFGGLIGGASCNQLAVLDTNTWIWDIPTTHGDPPCPRFGSSMAVYGGELWVLGGGLGGDLVRSGADIADVYVLNLSTWEWSRPELHGRPPSEACLGREAGHVLIGSKLLLFGGSLVFHNRVCYLDLKTRRWGVPEVLGKQPPGRMSGRMALVGDSIYMFGGWHIYGGEFGDLFRLKLVVDKDEELQQMAAKASESAPSTEEREEHLRNLIAQYNQAMSRMATTFMMEGGNAGVQELLAEMEELSEQIEAAELELKAINGHSDTEAESSDGEEEWTPDRYGSSSSSSAGGGGGSGSSDGEVADSEEEEAAAGGDGSGGGFDDIDSSDGGG